MRVSLEWLREFVLVSESADEVARRLTMLGLEVESIELVSGDAVFEINVTPNRPDCLSMIGVARELSAALGIPAVLPEHEVRSRAGELDFNIDIHDPSLCGRYAGRIVRGLRIGSSPEWLKCRLEKCGIRSINNVVDITNYVLIELGHPLHAFDLNKIGGHMIQVGTSANVKGRPEKMRIRTLDGNERELPEDALLIWDAERPVAIAGIMGGMETEVSDSTTDVFIESAYFDSLSVRRTSKATGIKTEASYRFERGVDIKMLKKALDRAAFLMKDIAGGTVYGKIDIYPSRSAPAGINVKYEKINRVLGLDLKEHEITGCLESLGFAVKKAKGHFSVVPPSYRLDVKRDADIIEEIVRTYGYDRVPATLPKAVIGAGAEEKEDSRRSFFGSIVKEFKESFLKSGFTEVINYSFMGPQDLDLLGMGQEDERRKTVTIRNPLSSEVEFMRTTLAPALIRNIVHNVSQGNRTLRLFEMSRVFFNKGDGSLFSEEIKRTVPFIEENHFAAALYKEKMLSLYPDNTPDFFVVKGVLEALFEDLKITDYSFVRSVEAFLHPGQSADVFIGGDRTGYIGALSPVMINRLDIKAHQPSIILLELDIDRIKPDLVQEPSYHPLPKYPAIERDTALVVDEALEAAGIISLLRSYSSELIEDVTLFDVYQGKNIPDGKKSIAFSVRYRASDRTLKDEEADAVHKQVVGFVIENTKGQIRS